MALIRIETNIGIPDDKSRKLAKNLIHVSSKLLGEPESEIRVEIAGNRKMRMAELDEPVVHAELRNVEFEKDRAKELTDALTPILKEAVGVLEKNVYIAVVTKRTSMWRVNGDLSRDAGDR